MYTFLALGMVGMVLTASSGAEAACSATGANVTAQGFLMDNLCIKLGNLLDNSSAVTLMNPEVHTVHCILLDECVASGYTILAPPATPGGKYSVKYQLGKDGSALAKAVAETYKMQMRGLQLTVAGIDDNSGELKCVSVLNSTASPMPGPGSNATSPAPSNSTPQSQTSLLSTITFAALSLLAASLMA